MDDHQESIFHTARTRGLLRVAVILSFADPRASIFRWGDDANDQKRGNQNDVINTNKSFDHIIPPISVALLLVKYTTKIIYYLQNN